MYEVEEVSGRAAFRRFVELPHVLFHDEPRWSAPLAAWDRSRLDPQRNPFFEAGDGAYFLVRRLGKVVGRITAHIATDGDAAGWFGFYDVVDDDRAAAALVDAAKQWLRERGCMTMTGPASFTVDDEPGLLVDGYDRAGATGRPWHPPWYASGLAAAGLEEVAGSERPTWRLPAAGSTTREPSGTLPPIAGPYGDPRLVFDGIAAVPDLTVARNSPWQLARRARQRSWRGCTVVDCTGPPDDLVPVVQAAAAAAGYEWVLAPWSPEPATPPETIHALVSKPIAGT